MKIGSRVRAWLLVMALVMMVSPAVGAQTAMDATPDAQAPVELVTGEEDGSDAGAGEGVDVPSSDVPDNGGETGEDTGAVSVEGPEVSTPGGAPGSEPAVEKPEPDEQDIQAEGSPEVAASESAPIQAAVTGTLVIALATSDNAHVPAGTEVCVSDPDEDCQEWTGEPLTFPVSNTWVSYYVGAAGYVPIYESVDISPGETVTLDLTLEKKATVSVSLIAQGDATVPAGTEVCLYGSDEWCQDWAGTALTFTVEGGRVSYGVLPPPDSGFATVEGTWDIAPGASVTQTITLQAATTLTVTVVTVDGGELPEFVNIYVGPSREVWQYFQGEPLTFTVAPGVVEYSLFTWGANSHYRDLSGTITVAEDGSTVLEIVLELMEPGILRVYVQADDGQPAPAGTKVCVSMPTPAIGDPVENLCQTWTSGSVTFALGQGEAFVTVTPPDGSGFEAETESFWVMMDEVTRAVFDLEYTGEYDAAVVFTLRSENPDIELDLDSMGVCVYTGPFDVYNIIGCQSPDSFVPNKDGSITAAYSMRAGDYNYLVGNGNTFNFVAGSFTAIANETTTIDVTIPADEVEPATIVVDVVTLDGGPVPDGTEVCASYNLMEEDDCVLWEGAALTLYIPAGPVLYGALPPDNSGYFPSINLLPQFAKAGETLHLTVTLIPVGSPASISMTVSDENPRSGDTVTYTIRATGTTDYWGDVSTLAYEAPVSFEIIDELPIEITHISVSCGGSYLPSIPGRCYDLDGNSLTVFGDYWIAGTFDITVTVTGTVTGAPGTVVTNSAYLLTDMRRERAQVEVARYIPADSPSATAVLTIAQEQVEPTPSPSPTPDPVDPTPSPTPAPVDPTPDPGDPGTTPTPTPELAEPDITPTPAPEQDPADESTPAAVTALPSTGDGAGNTPSLLIATLATAAMLFMGGAVLRVRAGHERG